MNPDVKIYILKMNRKSVCHVDWENLIENGKKHVPWFMIHLKLYSYEYIYKYVFIQMGVFVSTESPNFLRLLFTLYNFIMSS